MGRHNQKTNLNGIGRGRDDIARLVSRKHRSEIRTLTRKLLSITAVPDLLKTQSTWETHVEIDTILGRLKEIEPETRIQTIVEDWEICPLSVEAHNELGYQVELKRKMKELEVEDSSLNCEMCPRNREEHFDDLLSWVKGNGGNVENVTICMFDNVGYGLAARKDLKEGDLICSVPSKLAFNLDQIEESSLMELAANDRILKGMGNVKLALLLILEYLKGPSSFWYPYIASLPTKYNTVLYFTPEDFHEFKYSPVFERCLNLFTSIVRQYSYFHQIFHESKDEASQILRNYFTFNLYRWAVSTIMTRQNILMTGTNLVNSLIPLWDMCNHAQGYLTTFSTGSENVCNAFKPFAQGEQIFIHYGDRSSENFFLHNAFVIEGEDESYLLRLGISKQDVLYGQRAEVLEHHDLSQKSVFRIRKNADPMTPELEKFLTVVNMDGDQLRECLKYPEKMLPNGPEIECNNYKYLNTRLSIFLMPYNMKKKEDESSLSDTRRLIRALIEMEKRCILSALKITQEKLDGFKKMEEEKLEEVGEEGRLEKEEKK